MKKYISYLFLTFSIVLFFSACASSQNQIIKAKPQVIYNTYKKIDDRPKEVQPLYLDYFLDEDRNKVLNLMKIGLYSYQEGYYDESKKAFDIVLKNIESLNVNSDMTEKAKSLWHGESQKLFVGEPYERAMAYYYRGLLYLKDNDYENARASFRGGILQDSRSENEEYQADFKSLLLLDALSSKLNGEIDLFESSINEYDSISHSVFVDFDNDSTIEKSACRKNGGTPSWDFKNDVAACKLVNGTFVSYEETNTILEPKEDDNITITKVSLDELKKHNFFLFIDTGTPPQKLTGGNKNSELYFSPTFDLTAPKIQIDNNISKAYLQDELYFQASTRGGRQIDKIIEGKVQFKDNLASTGEALQKGGAVALHASAIAAMSSNNDNVRAAAGAVALVAFTAMAIGAVAETVSDAVVTAADSRYWDTLPGGIYLYSTKLPIGKHTIKVINNDTIKVIDVDIKNNDIVVKHIFPNIIKPLGIYSKDDIDMVLENEQSYMNQYYQSLKVDKHSEDSYLKNFFNKLNKELLQKDTK
jgi:hypothetical protein